MHTYPIVLGTAGHIDHGKTALVKALTGIDTDRLKVEKERGITTELGFAHLDLDGQRFGLVDVPGHERFIKAMVSGAGGLDLVCLVIAADEGIMPQTREHLDICELLAVRRGVVALTKRDLVDDEWLELITDEVRSGLAGSFLADARIVPVSAKAGTGLDDLRAEFIRLTDELPARDPDGVFRLPLDRVFSIRGFGTVVTGTILGGTVRLGDTVIAHPRGSSAKIRGIEVHGEAADTALAGMRCALNLSGVSRDDLRRGDILGHPDAVTPSHIIDARFRYLATSKAPLKRRSRVLFHHTTAQLMATLVLVENDQLLPGEEALVQIRLDITEPIAALPGDHFIARGFVIQEHYGTTLGGGEILRVQAPKVRRSAREARETLQRMAAAAADAERVALEIKSVAAAGIDVAELGRRLGFSHDRLGEILEELVADSTIVRARSGKGSHTDSTAVYCHAEPFARLEKQALGFLDEFHAAQPHKEGMNRQELHARLPRSLPSRLYDALIATLTRRGAMEAEADLVRRPQSRSEQSKAELSPLESKIAGSFQEWGITPERPKQIASIMGADAKLTRGALDRLLSLGVLIKVKPDLFIHSSALEGLRQKLVGHLDEHGQITPTEWKSITGASRKYSIPLAEYFDAQKLTLRVGDVRKRRG